jgi:hypothetical protein
MDWAKNDATRAALRTSPAPLLNAAQSGDAAAARAALDGGADKNYKDTAVRLALRRRRPCTACGRTHN